MPKPLDFAFKTYSINDPRCLAALFGGLPIDSAARIENVTKRIHAKRLDPDCILSVVSVSGERRLHFEAFANWRAAIRKRIYDYNVFYRHSNGASLESTVILFRPEGSRGVKVEETYEFNDGRHWGGVKFRVIKLREMDPEEAFRLGLDSALPWVVFMRITEAGLDRVFARIRELARTDKTAAADLAANVAWFSGLRYDWNELERGILRKIEMYIKEEVMAKSSYYQHVLAKGMERGEAKGAAKAEARGKAKGKAEGKAEAGISHIMAFLTAHYPGLEATRGLKAFAAQPVGLIEGLFQSVVTAKDRSAVEVAIRAAVRNVRQQ